jgi:Protein of unknown function (DUF2971)
MKEQGIRLGDRCLRRGPQAWGAAEQGVDVTKEADFKRQVRARMAQTGEKYTVARRALRDDAMNGTDAVAQRLAVKRWADAEYKPFADAWVKRWNQRSSKLPMVLYHYANAAAVEGILRSQTLWATHARHLNDTSELLHANSVLANAAHSLLDTYRLSVQQTYLRAAADNLLDAWTDLFAVYVACFCEVPDVLSQWRAYPASAEGYALGFAPNTMCRNTHLRLRRVTYDVQEQTELVREVLAFFATGLTRFDGRGPAPGYACQFALRETVHLLSECVFCFKHPGFHEEREWRLVHVVLQQQHWPSAPPRHRETEWGRVPYVELRPNGGPPGSTMHLPIVDARVGPSPDQDHAEASLRQLLRHAGYDVPITRSSIPLRV